MIIFIQINGIYKFLVFAFFTCSLKYTDMQDQISFCYGQRKPQISKIIN